MLIFRLFYFLYAAVIFILLLILFFPVIVVGSMWGKIKGGNFIYLFCSAISHIWLTMIGIRTKRIFEVPHDKHRSYIFVMNHISYLDAVMVVNILRQPVRTLGKIEMAKIPLFGYIYKKVVVTVDRSCPDNRAQSVAQLKDILHQEISVVLFPEGTFNETGKVLSHFYNGAFRIAIETQTPIKPVLLLDTYDRMHFKHPMTLKPGICRSVFLEEISVEGYTMDDLEKLKTKVYQTMEQKLIEYHASWIEKN